MHLSTYFTSCHNITKRNGGLIIFASHPFAIFSKVIRYKCVYLLKHISVSFRAFSVHFLVLALSICAIVTYTLPAFFPTVEYVYGDGVGDAFDNNIVLYCIVDLPFSNRSSSFEYATDRIEKLKQQLDHRYIRAHAPFVTINQYDINTRIQKINK